MFCHGFFLSFFLLSVFRRLISDLAEWNPTKIGSNTIGSNCDLKMHVKNLEYPSPTNQEPQNHLFGRLRNLTATLTTYICGSEQDIDNRSSVLTTTGLVQGSPTSSQNVINFGPQTASNSTCIFTHPPYILHSTSFPGFTDRDQQM